jgi:hypothetical protein
LLLFSGLLLSFCYCSGLDKAAVIGPEHSEVATLLASLILVSDKCSSNPFPKGPLIWTNISTATKYHVLNRKHCVKCHQQISHSVTYLRLIQIF